MKLNNLFTRRSKTIYQLTLTCMAILVTAFCLLQNTVHAQASSTDSSVSLLAIMGNRASISINSGQPKILNVGQEYQGIKLLAIHGKEATFRLSSGDAPRQMTLRIGQMPYTINATPAPDMAGTQDTTQVTTPTPQPRKRHGEIVLQRAQDNHFYTDATINGQNIHFMVDTGAAVVSLSVRDARRLGIDYTKGTPSTASTANGLVTIYRVTLHSITIQDVTLYNIAASVTPGLATEGLLGQSFLRNFKISIKDDQMVLQSR